MEEKLKMVMQEYIEKIEDICDILLEGINLKENLNLKTKKDFLNYRIKTKEMEFEIKGIRYKLHGKGCMAYNEKFFLDWDFGYRSRWCGIDPWKLAMTLRRNKSSYSEYYDGNLIKEICEQAVEDNIMFKQHEQYYFVIPEGETFVPEFPEKFDALIVEHLGSSCTIPRNKIIDRFIRKSQRVYNQIDKNKNRYILKFMLEGKEIYSIAYDDIGYPEKAIEIMSDEILYNLSME